MPASFYQFLLFVCLLYSCQTYSLLWKPPACFTPQTQPPHTHDVLWTSSWPYDKGRGEVKRKKQENDETTHFSSWWQKKCLQNPSSVWKLSAHWSGDRTLLLLSEKRRLVGKAPQAWRLLNQLSRYFVSAWICDRIVSVRCNLVLLIPYHQAATEMILKKGAISLYGTLTTDNSTSASGNQFHFYFVSGAWPS